MYVREIFTRHERAILSRFFTNIDGPVFALINLPEVVKGALFARYSRSHKSLRRLFLDEFYDQKDITLEEQNDSTLNTDVVSIDRAEGLFDRVFYEFRWYSLA